MRRIVLLIGALASAMAALSECPFDGDSSAVVLPVAPQIWPLSAANSQQSPWRVAIPDPADAGRWIRHELSLEPGERQVKWLPQGVLTSGPSGLRVRNWITGLVLERRAELTAVCISPDGDELLVRDTERAWRLALPSLTPLPMSDAIATSSPVAIDERGLVQLKEGRLRGVWYEPTATDLQCSTSTGRYCGNSLTPPVQTSITDNATPDGYEVRHSDREMSIRDASGMLVFRRNRMRSSARPFWSPTGDRFILWQRDGTDRAQLSEPSFWAPAATTTHDTLVSVGGRYEVLRSREMAIVIDQSAGKTLDVNARVDGFQDPEHLDIRSGHRRGVVSLDDGRVRWWPTWNTPDLYWLDEQAFVLGGLGGTLVRVSAETGEALAEVHLPSESQCERERPTQWSWARGSASNLPRSVAQRCPPEHMQNIQGVAPNMRTVWHATDQLLMGREDGERTAFVGRRVSDGATSSPAWSADGSRFAVSSGARVVLLTDRAKRVQQWMAPSRILDHTVSADGQQVAVVYAATDGLMVATYAESQSQARCTHAVLTKAERVLFGPSGRRLLVLSRDGGQMIDLAACSTTWRAEPAGRVDIRSSVWTSEPAAPQDVGAVRMAAPLQRSRTARPEHTRRRRETRPNPQGRDMSR